MCSFIYERLIPVVDNVAAVYILAAISYLLANGS
jgi:hypothetical protein